MSNNFSKGYQDFTENSTTQISTANAEGYVLNVEKAIGEFSENLNKFKGDRTGVLQLKGNIAEYYHSGTFNINARLNDSDFYTKVEASNGFASTDISMKKLPLFWRWDKSDSLKSDDVTNNFEIKFGLKYYKYGVESAKQQAKSYFEKYIELKKGVKDISVDDFVKKYNISDTDLLHDPIYLGQVRIIPKDQLEAAIEFLKNKIAKEKIIRPDQVKRYQDTLDLLSDKIISPDDTHSIALSEDDSVKLATLAKEGNFNASADGFATEQLINYEHILKQGLKAGTSAAVITLVLKLVPEIYKILNEQFSKGYIDEQSFKEIGFKAVSASTEAYLRGAIAGSLTVATKSGLLGAAIKSVSPNTIAAITVICFSTIKDSFDLSNGTLSQDEFANNLARSLFVTSTSLGFGYLFQTIVPLPVLGYLLGNFIGSMVGSFAYSYGSDVAMSFAVHNGITFFGIVNQNYTLPDEVLKEIGVEVFEYEKFFIDEFKIDEFGVDEFTIDEFEIESSLNISILRRGVIGVRQAGYV